MNGSASPRPFGLRDKLGYLFGDFGNDFTFIFASSFLMVFYTKVLGISGQTVGILFLAARFIDAVTDITMGRIVDTVKPAKDGRFRPWIRRMAGPVALASFLMYQSGMAGASMPLKILYMYITYILWGSVFYTSINIPYGSMASVISSEPAHRASLSTFRSVGASLASMVIGVGGPLLVYSRDSQGNQIVEGGRFTVIAGVFSLLAILCYALCYFMTAERVHIQPQKTENKPGFNGIVQALLSNRALLAIIGAAIMLLLAQLMLSQMNNYLFMDYFKNTAALSVVNMLSTALTLALSPFVVLLTGRFGKKETGVLATAVAGAAFLALYLLRVTNPVAYILLASLGYLGLAYFNLIIWANITDVIDYQEVRTHNRDDGTVYAVYSFARKVGQALAGGLGGFALTAIGYDELAYAQTETVNNAIYSIATLVPAAGLLLVAVILLFAYPLSKKAVEANTAELRRRHSEEL
ncbi:MAG: MFS transporter [Provencibacterium sp.]|jgi:GPH family glycoside/pentoside/hexuronide:cation symporter|nr:MFS transporter [Provencibacterium sp.]